MRLFIGIALAAHYMYNCSTNRSFAHIHVLDFTPHTVCGFCPLKTFIANYLTGDFNDGFGHESGTPRGDLNANNAFITSTYTLKSLVGTHCAINSLAADFNVNTDHHIYQPCLPHIFEALNQLDHSGDKISGEPFRSFKWKTAFMQSVTMRYD